MEFQIDNIYNQDCLSGMKQMPDNSVDIVITSPPYNYNLRIMKGKYTIRSVKDHNKYGEIFKDGMPMDEYFNWQKECITEMMRISKGLVFYNIQLLTGNKVALFRLFGEFAKQIKEVIIWDKIHAEPAKCEGILNSQYEFIIVFDKKQAIARQFSVFNSDKGTVSNVFQIGKNRGKESKKHKAVFPIELPSKILTLFSKVGDTVLDPFIGIGTTAVAAIQNNRHFIGFELIKEFYDAAIERIKKETVK